MAKPISEIRNLGQAVSCYSFSCFFQGSFWTKQKSQSEKKLFLCPMVGLDIFWDHQIIGTTMLHGELTGLKLGQRCLPHKGKETNTSFQLPPWAVISTMLQIIRRKEDIGIAHSFSIKRLSPYQLISTLKNFYIDASQTVWKEQLLLFSLISIQRWFFSSKIQLKKIEKWNKM